MPIMGGSVRSYELALEMSKKYKVTIVTSDRNTLSKKTKVEIISPNLKVIWIPNRYSNKMSFGSRILSFISFTVKTAKYSITERADIVISTSTPLTVAIPGLMHKIRYRSRFIFEVRDSWPKVPIELKLLTNPILIFLARSLEKLAYKYADHVVALSPGMAADIEAVHSKSKISVIPNFCNDIVLDSIVPFKFTDEIETGGKIILYAGTFGYVNNLAYIIQLAASLLDFDCKFVMVGDGKYKTDTIEYAKEMEVLNKNVFIFDAVDKNEIYRMILRSDFMISTVIDNPVMWANSANKFFDSLAFLKPVIINHKGWLADLIIENDIGVVLNPTVSNTEVKKISNILNKSNEDMSERIATISSQKFSFSSIYTKYEAILEGNI